jgi:hypothetical protein
VSRIASASISAALSFFAGILAVTGLRERPLIPAATKSVVIKVNEKLPEPNITMGISNARGYTKGEAIVGDLAPAKGWEDGRIVRTDRPVKLMLKRK